MKIQVDHSIKTGDVEEACSIAIDGDCIDADQCVIFTEMLRKVASGTFDPEQEDIFRSKVSDAPAQYPSEPFTNDPISGPQTLHDWRDRALKAEARVKELEQGIRDAFGMPEVFDLQSAVANLKTDCRRFDWMEREHPDICEMKDGSITIAFTEQPQIHATSYREAADAGIAVRP